MNDLKQIKEEIYNHGYVYKLLEELGCEHIKLTRDRYEAQLPEKFESSNPRSVQVYDNENLYSAVRSRGIKGDIFTLVAYIITENPKEEVLQKHLHSAKKKILELLGMKDIQTKDTNSQDDPNNWIKEIKKQRSKRFSLSDVKPNKPYPESVLDGFVRAGHRKFIEDDIPLHTQHEFNIGFCIQSERITIPIRNENGEVVAVKGRATKKEEEDSVKYLFLYPCNKSNELFNYHKAKTYIDDTIIYVESEKSVLKLWSMGYKNVVSQMGSEISKYQAKLIEIAHPDTKIILAYDSDKRPDEIKSMASVFDTQVYGMLDTKGLLGHRDAPCDIDKETFDYLYENCVFPIKNKNQDSNKK